jgi:propionyl-CoA carboxylase alpha chain
VRSGSEVGIYYDPMLAKVICWAPERRQAAAALASALARARIHGLTTNRDLLVRVLRHPAFAAGQTDTAFLDEHGLTGLAAPLADEAARRLSALAAALADAAARQASAKVLSGLPPGWRNVPSQPQRKDYALAGASGRSSRYEVRYRLTRDGLVTDGPVCADPVTGSSAELRLVSMTPDLVELEIAGVLHRFEVAAYPGLVCIDSALGPVALEPLSRFTAPASQAAAGSLLAPMPGTVARVGVTVGDQVRAGQPLLWLEAMKMEHVIAAPAAGVVIELPAAPGQQVEVGSVLAVVKDAEEES